MPTCAISWRRCSVAVSAGNPNILQHTKALCERALTTKKDAEYQAELGRQLRQMDQNKLATKAYRLALEMEAATPQPLLGMVAAETMNIGCAIACVCRHCQLLFG